MLITQRGGRRRALASLLTGALVAGLTFAGVAPAGAASDTVTVSGGSATWNFTDGWTSYVTGPIAKGSVTPALVDGKSVYQPAAGSFDASTGEGTVTFGGSTKYSGHDGLLDLTISDLRLRLTSETSGRLTADFGGTAATGSKDDVTIADVTIAPTRNGDKLTLVANGKIADGLQNVSSYFADYPGTPMSTLTATFDAPVPVAPATATTTTLGVSPAGTSVEGTAVTLSATVAPSAAGSVEFLDGTTPLATVPVSDGVALHSVAAPVVGAHSFTARFTPADTAAFSASTSAAVAHTVTAKQVDPPAPVADPKVSVTPSTDVDPAVANTFEVSGTGFVGAGAKYGAYVLLGETSVWSGGSALPGAGWLKQVFVPAAQVKDGAFTTQIVIPAGTLDATKSYQVATSAAHGLSMTDRTLDTFTPVTLQGAEPPAPVFVPEVEVFAADGKTALGSTVVRPGDVVVVKGVGFDPASNVGGRGVPIPAGLPQGTYVVFGSFAKEWQPSVGAPSSARRVGAQAWALAGSVLEQVPPAFQETVRKQWVDIAADGSFTARLTLGELEAVEGGSFGVYTYAAGGVKNAAQEIGVPVAFTNAPAPVFVPEVEVFAADGKTALGSTVVRPGDVVVVKGVGFDPASNVGGRGVPIPAGLPQGTYVVFGSFAKEWQPSVGAPSSARRVGAQAWALAGSVLEQVPPAFQETVRKQWVDIAADGSFTARLTLGELEAVEGGSFGVYTYAAGGVKNAAQEIGVPVAFTNAQAPAPLTVTPGASSVKAGEKLSLTVAGLGAGDKVSSVLLGGAPASFTVNRGAVSVTVPADLAPGQLAVKVVSELGASGQTTVEVVGKPAAMQVGSLRWGVKESFRSYITGHIAQGGAVASDGATVVDGLFGFGQVVGGTWQPGSTTGSVDYDGKIAFSGHGGLLNLTLANPSVVVGKDGKGTLVVDVRSANLDGTTFDALDVPFASLVLGKATVLSDGAVSYRDAAATLTAEGSQAFSDFYPAGESLDPVSFVMGAGAAPTDGNGNGNGGTIGNPGTGTGTKPLDPTVATLSTYQVVPGGQVTISGVGFGANEAGLRSIIRSTPRTLATGITANAGGAASATVTIPEDLEPGEHTLSLEGANHKVSAAITVTGPVTSVDAPGGATAATQCFAQGVNGATLSWGVSDPFRAYIAGPIAKGSVSTSGVRDNGSSYTWSGGKGSFNTDLGKGRTAFGGSVQFTGHAGILDLKISNPRVQVDGSTGTLVVDVVSSDMEGNKSTSNGVAFASLNLAGKKSTSGSTITWTGAPATLTASGAKAFAGFYEAGTALAPVTFSFPIGGDVECDAFSGLADTGTDASTLAALAVLFVLGGAGLVVAGNRRRARADA
ncbi:HtaA domain-containing protein [Oerskovia sp. Sa1BUA8]|uniref:HtaA domain-containing protein n=1 Tax=Oerskovia douganii TaxID=2762210 RepID=A0A9D5UEP4_9CELL|nr:HtaA domain-containing protein [Oerskovia douganii]MBE7701661.1 HtaA domain-containing protein [Oerskovia douganii]